MKTSCTLLASVVLFNYAFAFPHLAAQALNGISARAGDSSFQALPKRTVDFDPTLQYVSNQGEYAFVAPTATDARGPCPGLNAMANHGYLPHDGVASIEQFIEGTYKVFGMGVDLSTFLAVYGAVLDGNVTAWSIGGPTTALGDVLTGLLGTPTGMSGSHNKYENDASPMRGDLYLYGNDYKTQLPNFEYFYNLQEDVADDEVNFDIPIITEFRHYRFDSSIATNPYFFNGPFSGVIASPAAYSFIYRFMANKSSEYPEGRLDREVLKSFYAITGEPGSFEYTAGYERIPDNWYKRAIGDEYTILFFATDALAMGLEYPEFLSIGGNLGAVNSFAGLDPGNLTGGIYETSTLLEGNNLICFGFELLEESLPDLLEGLFTDVTEEQDVVAAAIKSATSSLSCPQIETLQYSQFLEYPGYTESYDGYTPLRRK